MFTRAVAAFLFTALTVSGCGGSDPDAEPKAEASSSAAPDVTPASGDTITASDYTYVVPEGWQEPPNGIPGFDMDSLALDRTDDDGFSDNVNVLKLDGRPEESIRDSVDDIAKQMSQAGVLDPETKEIGSIDGEDSLHVSSHQMLNGRKNLTEQYFVFHNDTTYVVTFSFSTTVKEVERDETAQSVLSTWKWAS